MSSSPSEHAINNLLGKWLLFVADGVRPTNPPMTTPPGGQYFQPTDLAALALQLDEEENGELNERRNESVNMDDSG